jgi:phosphomannomutase
MGDDLPVAPTRSVDPALAERISLWRSGDCDPGDIATLDELVSLAVRGDEDALAELHDAFAGSLRFGTAGLRGRMAPGPHRMNTAVVRRAAYALAHTVTAPRRIAVIGYDGRDRSFAFARESARVLCAAGWQAHLLPRALPTPVLAFAVKHLHADLGIMVTASHNPAQDNGYKVYLADGRQIIEPTDAHIADAIADAPPAISIPVADQWNWSDSSILEAYLRSAIGVVAADTPRDITVAHTALHGVATEVFAEAMERAGFATPIEVAEQRDPDPSFPTVDFPNPEESGALDLLVECAIATDADIAIAHDPDADRCAVAVPTDAGWQMLTGDNVGGLLGWWLINRPGSALTHGAFAASLVSGTQLARIAEASGLTFHTTLTGFKWISRVPDLVFGYEEALGYCVDPTHVADKDGITAGLLVCELAAYAKQQGSDLVGIADVVAGQFGVEITRQISVRFTRAEAATDLLTRLIATPPTHLGGLVVTAVSDLSQGANRLAPTPGLSIDLDTPEHPPGEDSGSLRARVIMRPSGTEPKLKAYVQIHASATPDVAASRAAAHHLLDQLVPAVSSLMVESPR